MTASAHRAERKRVVVYVVALEGGLLSTVVAPLEIFRLAGLRLQQLGNDACSPYFAVRVIGAGGVLRGFGGVDLSAQTMASLPRPDLVFVASGGLQPDGVASAHAALREKLGQWHQAGSCIAAVCTGVIVLAEAGLLDRRRATTHWAAAPWFRARYPRVKLLESEMITRDARLWCAAGGYAATDLSLRLVAHFAGADAAHLAAQTLLLDAPRSRQTPYMTLDTTHDHADPLVERVQREIALHPANQLSIAALARSCCLSPRSLMRRFKRSTGTTVLDYQQAQRVEEAKRLLADSRRAIGTISADVGYENVAFFRDVFKRKVGTTPVEYRKRILHGGTE